jgi:hypothetical protein
MLSWLHRRISNVICNALLQQEKKLAIKATSLSCGKGLDRQKIAMLTSSWSAFVAL